MRFVALDNSGLANERAEGSGDLRYSSASLDGCFQPAPLSVRSRACLRGPRLVKKRNERSKGEIVGVRRTPVANSPYSASEDSWVSAFKECGEYCGSEHPLVTRSQLENCFGFFFSLSGLLSHYEKKDEGMVRTLSGVPAWVCRLSRGKGFERG